MYNPFRTTIKFWIILNVNSIPKIIKPVVSNSFTIDNLGNSLLNMLGINIEFTTTKLIIISPIDFRRIPL